MASAKANHNRNMGPQWTSRPSRPLITESDHSERQAAIDESSLKSLAAGRLMIVSRETGKSEPAPHYYAPSRTRVELLPNKEGHMTPQVVGGLVTAAEAQLIYPDQAQQQATDEVQQAQEITAQQAEQPTHYPQPQLVAA